MQKWLALVWRAVINLDWIIAILLSVFFSILGILGWFPPNVIFATTLLVLGILSVGALRDRLTSEHRENVVNELVKDSSVVLQSNLLLSDAAHTGISRIFPHAVNFNWLSHIDAARHVTIVRIQHLHFLWEDRAYFEALEAVLNRGGTVTLVMADPRSPAIWLRYQEEHRPDRPRIGAAEDLARVSHKLYEWKQRLALEGRDISRLLIKVFQNYPTQAFYKFDDKIFIYDYPYQQQGFSAPMFLFTDPTTSVHRFLNQCIQSVITSSLPLEDVIDDIWDKYTAHYFSDQQVFRSEIVAVPKDKS